MSALCSVFRSPKRADTYLYLLHPADFSKLPEPLRQHFGPPIEVMAVPLRGQRTLARLSAAQMLAHLQQHGYYLQLPEAEQNLLQQHLRQQQRQKQQE